MAVALLAAMAPLSAQPPGAANEAGAAGATPATARPRWAEAVEQAWQRSLEVAQAQGQHSRARAEEASASSWLAAPPALELAQREGQGHAASGQRETEIGVVLPMWRWGQRDAAGQAAQAESDVAAATERVARLRLAAQVRDAAAALLTQEVESDQLGRQLVLFERLSADVDRRVKAGDLAPADGWAMRAEALAVQAQAADQRRQWQAQLSQWRLLTGMSAVPDLPDSRTAEPGESADLPAHPEAVLAAHTVELARRRVALARASRGDAPEIGVGMREERPGQGAGAQRSVAISLRLPFGATAHAEPRVAAALAEQQVALAAEQQLKNRLAADIEVARLQWRGAIEQEALEGQRAALLRERATHLEKSFHAGETASPDLLRALIAAAQADSAKARQRIAAGIALIRLQHAQGLIHE